MDYWEIIVVFITLALAGTFLAVWIRRDKGIVPSDRLPEVLHEALDGHSYEPSRNA